MTKSITFLLRLLVSVGANPYGNILLMLGHLDNWLLKYPHLPTLTLDIFALIWPKSHKKTHFGTKMFFFWPKDKIGGFRKYFHHDKLKNLTNTTYYHPLAHLNFGYSCPYMTKKSKKHILDPKCAFFDPKMKSEPSKNIVILTGAKKWHRSPTIIHLPTLTLDIFALIWPKN